jgi:Mor family transcriptional regulator
MIKKSESRAQWLHDFSLGLRDEFNLSENDALSRATSLMERIGSHRPADYYYWPAVDKSQRDEAILKNFNGRNILEVCKKFHVSSSTVYSIRSKSMQKRNVRTELLSEIPALPPKNKK